MGTDSHGRILLPSKTIIKMFDEESYRSIKGKNILEGILLPWNLRTTWKRGNNSLFYIVAFNLGIPPEPLLMDLLESLGSRMVVEDQRSTERVISRISRILRISEPYHDGTTEIPDKSISDRKPQFASHKSERSFELTTNPTHYPEKNGIPERTNPKICKLFFPILEYNKKPYTTHKLMQLESNKQIPKRERFSEESKKSSTFRNHRPELLNNWRIHSIIHTSLPSSYEENDPFEENFFKPPPESTKEGYEIKSIIPKGKDLPISTKEKDVFPTPERQYRLQLDIHQPNTGFTDRITIQRKPFSSDVTKLRDTTWTYSLSGPTTSMLAPRILYPINQSEIMTGERLPRCQPPRYKKKISE